MMGYCAPLLPHICQFIDDLKLLYTKENPERLKIIHFIESLLLINDKHSSQIILGACVYGLEKIASEYLCFSPDINHSRFFNCGSELYTALKKGLCISTINPLDDQQKLIYLVFLYDYLTHHNGSPFLNDLKNMIKIVLSRLDLEINLLLKEKPTSAFLEKNFNELPTQYREEKKKKSFLPSLTFGYGASEREHYIRLIEWIKNNFSGDPSSSTAYNIRYGALLYIMSEIEAEYHYRSPEHSYLYTQCQRILNIHSSFALDKKLGAKYLSDLNSFLLDPHHTDSFEGDCIKLSKKLCAITDPKAFDTEHSYIESIAHNVSEFGVKILAGQVAIDFFKNIAINEKMIISGIGYITGAVSPQTVLLCNLIAALLNEKIKSNIISTISDQVNSLIIYTATQPIIITYKSLSKLNEFASHLLSKAKKNIGNIDNIEWIYALMCLPDDVFPQSKKHIIENVVELNKSMQPPQDTIPHEYEIKLYQ